MSVAYMGMAFKTKLPPIRKFVLVALCDMANDADHGLTYPSISTIATHCSVDRRTVERAIKELETEGFLDADRRPGMKSRYQINLEKLSQAQAEYTAERSQYLRQKVAGGAESQAADSRSTPGDVPHPPTAESRTTCGRESHITRKNQTTKPEVNQNTRGVKSTGDKQAYSNEFETAWQAYPSRPGANKADAYKAWQARIKEGVSPDSLIDGVRRYAAYCSQMLTEARYIKMPATFFGPGRHYETDFVIPAQSLGQWKSSRAMSHNEADALNRMVWLANGNPFDVDVTRLSVAQIQELEVRKQVYLNAKRPAINITSFQAIDADDPTSVLSLPSLT